MPRVLCGAAPADRRGYGGDGGVQLLGQIGNAHGGAHRQTAHAQQVGEVEVLRLGHGPIMADGSRSRRAAPGTC